MRQSVSKGRAALGFKVVICALASGVELTCQNIGFDLTIPLLSAELVEPFGKMGQLISRKS